MKTGRFVRIASSNSGKLAEYRRLLGDEFEVGGIQEIDISMPPETGKSYAENARIKARFVASVSGDLTLGDDSGLEVDALGGKPGIRSARYAGQNATDAANIEKVLDELVLIEDERRTARFVCALALSDPAGEVHEAEGACDGHIGRESSGTNGFGYDPIFMIADGRTIAELPDIEKDAISHRGRAVRAILPALRQKVSGQR